LRRVLLGVPSKDMPMHRMRVKLVTALRAVNAACDRVWGTRLRCRKQSGEYGNSGARGGG